MSVLVNVEGIEFEEMIPYLKKCDKIMYYIDTDNEEGIFKLLKIQFDKLKQGLNIVDGSTIFHSTILEYLEEKKRVFKVIDSRLIDYKVTPVTKEECIEFVKQLDNVRLSKSGRTNFTVENIDWPFIMEALEHYEKYVNEAEMSENSIMTKEFVQERVKSLIETFTVELKN